MRRAYKNSKIFTYNNEHLSLTQIYNKYKPPITVAAFKARVLSGKWTIDEALKVSRNEKEVLEQCECFKRKRKGCYITYLYKHEWLNISELSRKTGIPKQTIASRIEAELKGRGKYKNIEELCSHPQRYTSRVARSNGSTDQTYDFVMQAIKPLPEEMRK